MQAGDIQQAAQAWDALVFAVAGFGFGSILAYASIELSFGPCAVMGRMRKPVMAIGFLSTTASFLLPFAIS